MIGKLYAVGVGSGDPELILLFCPDDSRNKFCWGHSILLLKATIEVCGIVLLWEFTAGVEIGRRRQNIMKSLIIYFSRADENYEVGCYYSQPNRALAARLRATTDGLRWVLPIAEGDF